MEAQLDLGINNFLHGGVFDARQLLLLGIAIVKVCACLEEAIGAKKRAKMLCSERRLSMQVGSHGQGGLYRSAFGSQFQEGTEEASSTY